MSILLVLEIQLLHDVYKFFKDRFQTYIATRVTDSSEQPDHKPHFREFSASIRRQINVYQYISISMHINVYQYKTVMPFCRRRKQLG